MISLPSASSPIRMERTEGGHSLDSNCSIRRSRRSRLGAPARGGRSCLSLLSPHLSQHRINPLLSLRAGVRSHCLSVPTTARPLRPDSRRSRSSVIGASSPTIFFDRLIIGRSRLRKAGFMLDHHHRHLIVIPLPARRSSWPEISLTRTGSQARSAVGAAFARVSF